MQKCPYCDFNSHALPATDTSQALPETAYIKALIRDLETELPAIWGRAVQSIFIGGGTPSLMSAQGMDKLLGAIRARLNLAPHAEITLEANPGTFEQQKFAAFHELGINRLSLGVQSFNDDMLQRLGRIHDSKQASNAIHQARRAGFDNINLDLMYGLPQQALEQAISDIDQAISLQPEHISHYQLTLEPNTQFYHQPPPLPDDDLLWPMQLECQHRLAQSGYEQYEISAYSREAQYCRHNVNYWQFGDYLGIGAGAHSKITDASEQSISRRSKQRLPRTYIDQAGSQDMYQTKYNLQRSDIGLEFAMNVFRLNSGFSPDFFTERTGLPLSLIENALRLAEQRGLISWDIGNIGITPRGQRYLNDLLVLFLPDRE